MPQSGGTAPMGAHPFPSLLRSSDRDRLIVQLVATVWDSILGLSVLSRPDLQDLHNYPGHEFLSGVIQISGEWAGAVVMCVPIALARDCGAHMYGCLAAELTPDEVADSWGELVNMVGGNLKALLPPPVQLNELTFACLGNRIRVTVLKGVA